MRRNSLYGFSCSGADKSIRRRRRKAGETCSILLNTQLYALLYTVDEKTTKGIVNTQKSCGIIDNLMRRVIWRDCGSIVANLLRIKQETTVLEFSFFF